MDCDQAMKKIIPFINNQLTGETALQFAEHVLACKNCKNELEINYCLMEAIRQLEDDNDTTSNFISELTQKLNNVIRKGKHEKRAEMIKRLIVVIELLILGLMIGIRYL